MAETNFLTIKTYWKNLSDCVVGIGTKLLSVVIKDSSGVEKFTNENPGVINGAVTLNGSLTKSFTFQNHTSSTGNGESLTVDGYKNLTVDILGTSTSRTVEFHGVGPGGNDTLISGINRSGLADGTSTTANGETWQFDITGLASVYFKITAVSGGNVTIVGKAVA